MKLIEDANKQALARILEGEPRLIDIVPARDVLEGLKERMILHAGPPITWDRMCGPMRGAVAGAIVFEGWAPDLKPPSNSRPAAASHSTPTIISARSVR
ncbi:hypothetical protein ACQPTN_35780 [Bradyrhizobium sp. 13971]